MDFVALRDQAREWTRLQQEENDLEVAYRLQREEALRVSAAESGGHVEDDVVMHSPPAAEARFALQHLVRLYEEAHSLKDRMIAQQAADEARKTADQLSRDRQLAFDLEQLSEDDDDVLPEPYHDASLDFYLLIVGLGVRRAGPAACGAVLKASNGELLWQRGLHLATASQYEAELQAVILGVRAALDLGVTNLTVGTTQQHVISQLSPYSQDRRSPCPQLQQRALQLLGRLGAHHVELVDQDHTAEAYRSAQTASKRRGGNQQGGAIGADGPPPPDIALPADQEQLQELLEATEAARRAGCDVGMRAGPSSPADGSRGRAGPQAGGSKAGAAAAGRAAAAGCSGAGSSNGGAGQRTSGAGLSSRGAGQRTSSAGPSSSGAGPSCSGGGRQQEPRAPGRGQRGKGRAHDPKGKGKRPAEEEEEEGGGSTAPAAAASWMHAAGAAGAGDGMFLEQCQICLEDVRPADMLALAPCRHSFCRGCTRSYVESQAQEARFPVRCPLPNCGAEIPVAACRDMLLGQPNLFEILQRLEVEAALPDHLKFYCPGKDCSAMQLLDEHVPRDQPSECNYCCRLLCAHCRSTWHDSMTCAQYQALPEDMRAPEDRQLLALARTNRWRSCSNCKAMIELDHGCNHITCTCGHEFCYTCGAPWDRANNRLSCGCRLWDENNLLRRGGGEPHQQVGGRGQDRADENEFEERDEHHPYEQHQQYVDGGDGYGHPAPRQVAYGGGRQPQQQPHVHRGYQPPHLRYREARGQWRHPRYKTRLCQYWMYNGGDCPYGEYCQFAHGEEELRQY